MTLRNFVAWVSCVLLSTFLHSIYQFLSICLKFVSWKIIRMNRTMTQGRIHFHFRLVSYPLFLRLHANRVHVVVGASAPRTYWRVALARASTLSASVVRTLRGGERLQKVFCLVALSLAPLRSQCLVVCGSPLQRGHSGSAEVSRLLAYVFSTEV